MNLYEVVAVEIQNAIPRMLTQLCRDQEHPLYGSFDRDHWHYKIRDFSSMVLHQGVILIDLLAEGRVYLAGEKFQLDTLSGWRDGCLKFWAAQQRSDGGFDEYYPYESGFAATAFSLYATAVVGGRAELSEEIARAMGRAVRFLLKGPELGASNQEAIALAACSLTRSLDIAVNDTVLAGRWTEFFERQTDEGWFEEYGGGDTGYLSVTCDALWDYYVVSRDDRAIQAMARAANYIAQLQGASGAIPEMVNSRNTGYIVPYGLANFGRTNTAASSVISKAFQNIQSPRHFVHAVDDRYTVHYIHTSIFRSLSALRKMKYDAVRKPHGKQWFPNAGIYVDHSNDTSVFVSAKKGGVVIKVKDTGKAEVDYGWRGRFRGRMVTSHWQSPTAKVEFEEHEGIVVIRVGTYFTFSRFLAPSPSMHSILRMAAFSFGRKLMSKLKNFLIFRQLATELPYKREIRVNNMIVSIKDWLPASRIQCLRKAPQYSLRHVSSSGSFDSSELHYGEIDVDVCEYRNFYNDDA